MDGTLNVVPEPWMTIWNAYVGGRLREAEITREEAWGFVNRMLECGGTYHALAKAVLGIRLDIKCGDARTPVALLTSQQRDEFKQLI